MKPRVFLAPGEFLPLLPTKITESDHCNLKSSIYELLFPWGDFSTAAMEHHAALPLLFSSTLNTGRPSFWRQHSSGHPSSLRAGGFSPSTLCGLQSMVFKGQTRAAQPTQGAVSERGGLLILLWLPTAKATPHFTLRELNLHKVNTIQSDYILKNINPNAVTH